MPLSELFAPIHTAGHEMVAVLNDSNTGLRGFIALHNTNLGPGLGGCRMKVYESEQAAFDDALALSRAMTYKNALAGLNFGGGKAVMILDKPGEKPAERVKALARRVQLLNGSYYGAGDIGSTTDDLRLMKTLTPYLGGLAKEDGGLGDSSVLTAYGVYLGMKATAKWQRGNDSLAGLRVAVQGAGKVGFYLMEHLVKEGAQVVAADTVESALSHLRATLPQVDIIPSEEIMKVEADIFSPNAIGGLITEAVAQQLKVSMIVGGANNPVASLAAHETLAKRNILFAPDFAVNSGGVTSIAFEIEGKTLADATSHTEKVYDTMLKVYQTAQDKKILPYEAACLLAEERFLAKKP